MRRYLAVAAAVAATTGGGYALGAATAPSARDLRAAQANARTTAGKSEYARVFAAARERGVEEGFTDGAIDGRVRGNIRGRLAGGRAVQKKIDALDALARKVGHSEREIPSLDSSDLTGSVLVVGDSLEVLTSPYLQRHLPGMDIEVDAKGGYNSIQLFGLFNRSYDPAQDVIVFDAGTNDNPAYPQILQGNLARVAKIVGDRCMVVPSIHGLHPGGVSDAGKNRVVEAFAASRPGTQVPDWRGFVATHPEMMQADNLHPNAQGQDARAQLIAEGVRGCLQFDASFGLG
jgi:hypothetical protein